MGRNCVPLPAALSRRIRCIEIDRVWPLPRPRFFKCHAKNAKTGAYIYLVVFYCSDAERPTWSCVHASIWYVFGGHELDATAQSHHTTSTIIIVIIMNWPAAKRRNENNKKKIIINCPAISVRSSRRQAGTETEIITSYSVVSTHTPFVFAS